MLVERTSVGLDVHARSVVAAAIDGVTGELRQARLTPSHDHIRSWIGELDGPVAVAYEAGPTGFGLYRALTAAGVRCVVVAPSKLQRPSGDRVKTDAKDAVHLARLLRIDEITAVAVPSVAQEAARDLVRAREDCRADLMRARHRLSKLLLRQGIVYSDGNAWTNRHDAWLRRQRFDNPVTTMTFESDHETVLAVTAAVTGWTQRSRNWPPTASSPLWCDGCAGSPTYPQTMPRSRIDRQGIVHEIPPTVLDRGHPERWPTRSRIR